MIFAVACPLPPSSCPVCAQLRSQFFARPRIELCRIPETSENTKLPERSGVVPQAPPGGRTYARRGTAIDTNAPNAMTSIAAPDKSSKAFFG